MPFWYLGIPWKLWPMGLIGLILNLVFWVGLIGVIAYAFGWRSQFNQMSLAQTSQTPVEILKARYARGEITREEYDQMRRDLDG